MAKGFIQKFGIDYFETFLPVVRYSSIRLLIAFSAKVCLDIDHLDVDMIFLNGELSKNIYMFQLKNFVDQDNKDKMCLLNKAIYGLKVF